jgi:hypothetical protein
MTDLGGTGRHQPSGPSGPAYQPPAGGPSQPTWQPPGGDQQPPPSGYPYQQPPPRKRHRVRNAVLFISTGSLLLIIVAVVLSNIPQSSGTGTSAGTNTGTGNSQAAQGTGNSVARIGDKVRDGKFEFVVTKVTHAKSVSDTQFGLGETAQGRFTIVSLRVTNIGSESQTLDDSAQAVFDTSGHKFTADSAADIDLGGANGQNSTWLEDINPGNTVHGRIAFDMPAGAKAVKIELHDSIFSDGVIVTLS